jgi:hypothetical protein
MIDGLASAIALVAAVCEPRDAPETIDRLLGTLIKACGTDEPLKRSTLELIRQRLRNYAK